MAKTFPLMALLALALAGAAQAQAGTGEDVRKVLDDQTAAWNRGDLVAFMQGYTKSPELTFFSGDSIQKGWDATLARYRQRYQGAGKEMGQLSFTDSQIEQLGPDFAMMTARWHLTMRDGKKQEGLTTVICRRTKDGWKIVHDHSS